jgi:hypothetical protein
MYTNTQLSDAVIAALIAAHPLLLQFTEPAVAALAAIATRDAPATSETERRLLRRALAAIDAAEIALSREARS